MTRLWGTATSDGGDGPEAARDRGHSLAPARDALRTWYGAAGSTR
jgi:hypothetical protein